MKKIFLTSGLVLCMACPAFAVVDINGNTVNNPNCSQPTLNGTSGTSTFTANWTAVWHTITLDEDDNHPQNNINGIGLGTSNIGNDNNNLSMDNTLFSEEGKSGVYKKFTGTYNGNNMVLDSTSFVQSTETVLNTKPVGKTVTYTISTITPSGASGSPTYPSITGVARAFDGFWDSVDGTNNPTQYITDQGVLTSDGASVADHASQNETWYARYKCATPTFNNVTGTNSTTPVWAGYTFLGYTATNNANDATYITPGCIEESTNLYARWEAQSFTITYTCGSVPTGASSNFTSGHTTTGNDSNASDTVYMDASYQLMADAGNCELPGYKLKGWVCDHLPTPTNQNELLGTVSGVNLYAANASGTYNYAGNITCVAEWAANTINLSWQVGAGTVTTSGDNQCTYDDSISLPDVSRPGYKLSGWTVTNTPAN